MRGLGLWEGGAFTRLRLLRRSLAILTSSWYMAVAVMLPSGPAACWSHACTSASSCEIFPSSSMSTEMSFMLKKVLSPALWRTCFSSSVATRAGASPETRPPACRATPFALSPIAAAPLCSLSFVWLIVAFSSLRAADAPVAIFSRHRDIFSAAMTFVPATGFLLWVFVPTRNLCDASHAASSFGCRGTFRHSTKHDAAPAPDSCRVHACAGHSPR